MDIYDAYVKHECTCTCCKCNFPYGTRPDDHVVLLKPEDPHRATLPVPPQKETANYENAIAKRRQ